MSGRLSGWCGVIALLTLTSGCSSSAPIGRWFQAAGPMATPDGTAQIVGGGASVQVYEVRGERRAGLLRAEAGVAMDPFDVQRDGEPVFRTFAVEVSADRAGVRFNPSLCVLHVGGGERRYPRGYTDLYPYLIKALRDDRMVSPLARLLPETAVSIPRGRKVTQLLVFTRLPAKASDVELELDGIDAGERSLTVRIPFSR